MSTGRVKSRLAMDANGQSIQGAMRPRVGGSQNVSYTAVAGVSTILTDSEIVRLISTTDCHIRFGESNAVAATSTDMFMKASEPEYFSLRGSKYISAIRDSADGTLNIQIME
jgi:hypothetical protein